MRTDTDAVHRIARALFLFLLFAGGPLVDSEEGSWAPATRGATLFAQATAPSDLPGLDPTRPLSQFSLDNWLEGDGLPQNYITSIAQTTDGYLWAGSERGLIRFDGLRFTVFTPESTPGLPSAWVTALHADPDGTLWIGTGGQGVARYRAGRFTSVGGDEAIRGPTISAFLRDEGGRLWVGTVGGGLFRVEEDGEGARATRASDELSAPFVTALIEDPRGMVLIGTGGTVDRLDPTTGRVDTDVVPLQGIAVRALLSDPDGTLWIGTGGNGVHRYRDGVLSPLDPDGELGGSQVSALLRDREGALWVGTNGGGLFREWEGRVDRLPSRAEAPVSLVQALFEDREGNLWLGLIASGLIRLQDGIFDTFGLAEGLSMNVALALREVGDGSVWVGTPGQGVNRIHGDEVESFGANEGIGSEFVMTVAEAPDGAVWIGTLGGGVRRIEGRSVTAYGPEDGLLARQVTALEWGSAGDLWVGYAGAGLHRWLSETERVFDESTGLPHGAVTTVYEDGEGRIWAGTRDGVARIEGGEVEAFGTGEGLPHGHVTGLYVDGDGSAWVATMGGLARIRDGQVRSLGVQHGLPPLEPMGVSEDRYGYLWLSTNQGLVRVARSELDEAADGVRETVTATTFGRADGLRSAEANGGIHPSAWRGEDGFLWFPTMAGAVRVDPSRTDRPTLNPDPVLESLLAGETSIPLADSVELAIGKRALEFRFAAPTFVAPERVGLRYRLEGFDDDWRSAADDRSARYTNVPPGRYRFRVEAADRAGEWSGREASMAVTVPSHWHERRTLHAGAALLFLLLGGVGYRLRIRGMERREQRLMEVVREREAASAALRRSEEQLHLALEAGRMGTWQWDLDTGALVWSTGMESLFGPRPLSFAEFRETLRRRIPQQMLPPVEEVFDRMVHRELQEFRIAFAFSGPDEETRQLELRGRWVGGPEEGRRIAGVAADVTALIATQEALRVREEELRQAQKMEAVGRLAGGVAHDFNNLLAVIGMSTRMAAGEVGPGSAAGEELREAIRASDRASELTRQLLAFSRRQILQPRILDLNECVEGVRRMLARLIRSNVELRTELAADLAPIRADLSGVEQILVNLVVNAQDAMPTGGIVQIATRNAPGDPEASRPILQEPHVVLQVSDTGRGMDEETLSRVFEPFFTTKELGEGTGLGLASVYGVVQQSGGHVEVRSRVRRGTDFLIHFPVERSP